MKVLKQPWGFDFEQPLLNKLLRVYASVMHQFESVSGRGGTTLTYYDSKTREKLYPDNWRVKIIRKLGT